MRQTIGAASASPLQSVYALTPYTGLALCETPTPQIGSGFHIAEDAREGSTPWLCGGYHYSPRIWSANAKCASPTQADCCGLALHRPHSCSTHACGSSPLWSGTVWDTSELQQATHVEAHHCGRALCGTPQSCSKPRMWRLTTVVGLCVGHHDVVQGAPSGCQLLLQGLQVQAPKLLVGGVHQGGLVAKDQVGVVGGALLQTKQRRSVVSGKPQGSMSLLEWTTSWSQQCWADGVLHVALLWWGKLQTMKAGCMAVAMSNAFYPDDCCPVHSRRYRNSVSLRGEGFAAFELKPSLGQQGAGRCREPLAAVLHCS